jgi:hypothetical protein
VLGGECATGPDAFRAAMSRTLVFLFALSSLPACGRVACAAAQLPDQPVPAGEPRATLAVKLDLPRAANCDEKFDLAIYEDRGVELVTWDGGGAGACKGRRATIRYLPKKLDRSKLLRAVEKLALATEVVEG